MSQSITSGSLRRYVREGPLVRRPLEVGGGHGGELGERRLRAGGDDRRARLEVERRRERLVAGGERDEPPALAHDELGGGGGDPAGGPQRRPALPARGGGPAQRGRGRAPRPHAPRGARQRVGGG